MNNTNNAIATTTVGNVNIALVPFEDDKTGETTPRKRTDNSEPPNVKKQQAEKKNAERRVRYDVPQMPSWINLFGGLPHEEEAADITDDESDQEY